MALAHYRIYELDFADRCMDDYSVMCRSDTAALAMACKGAEDHGRGMGERTAHRPP